MNIQEKIGAGVLAVIFGSILFYIVSVYAVMANGYVGYIMWGWFAPEVIKGQITSMWDLIFVSMTVKIFTPKNSTSHNPDSKGYKPFLLALAMPWVWLLLGWVIKNKFWIFN